MSKTIENYNGWNERIRLIYGNADHGTVEPKEMTIFITRGNH